MPNNADEFKFEKSVRIFWEHFSISYCLLHEAIAEEKAQNWILSNKTLENSDFTLWTSHLIWNQNPANLDIKSHEGNLI